MHVSVGALRTKLLDRNTQPLKLFIPYSICKHFTCTYHILWSVWWLLDSKDFRKVVCFCLLAFKIAETRKKAPDWNYQPHFQKLLFHRVVVNTFFIHIIFFDLLQNISIQMNLAISVAYSFWWILDSKDFRNISCFCLLSFKIPEARKKAPDRNYQPFKNPYMIGNL